jgi:hypothetical protein
MLSAMPAGAIIITAVISAAEIISGGGRQLSKLPTIPIGGHQVSRLIVGGNPFSGNSHISDNLDGEMRDYFTMANIKKALLRAEESGYTAFQARGDEFILRLVNEYRNDGGKLDFIAQTVSELADIKAGIRMICAYKPLAVYHHGTRTDNLWHEGRLDEVRDTVKFIRDQGVLTGVASHVPEIIQTIEDEDWDVDFYLASFYNLGRDPRESFFVSGARVAELFDDSDRDKMTEVIRQVAKPCLAIKVLAAGRKGGWADSPESLRESFDYLFRNVKPGDGAIVGVFPKYSDQIAENAELVRNLLGA